MYVSLLITDYIIGLAFWAISIGFKYVAWSETKAVFGCVKAFSENFLFSGNAIFRKGKCIQVFGCARNSFYGNEILVFVSGIRFTEMRFTENHF